MVVRGGWAGRVGLFDTAMFDAAADCFATRADYASTRDNVYCTTHKDIDMDSYTDSNGSTHDADCNCDLFPVPHIDPRRIFFPVRDVFAHSDEDTGRAGHAAKDGNVRAGNSRVDPDHNGDR
jgi:hypothetical protein